MPNFIYRLKNVSIEEILEIDERWLQIGATDIENGFMSVTRSIAKPGK